MSELPNVMWSISQIAERDEISRQAVSKIVKKLVADHDIPVERDKRGRISSVSLAHWDKHREQYNNPAMKPPATEPAPEKPKDSFEEARRQSEWLKLDRAKIDYAETAGKLVRVDKVAEALERTGLEIQARIDRLQNKADELALAAVQEGVHGLRVKLRQVAFEINQDIANRLEELSLDAPARDDALHTASEDLET